MKYLALCLMLGMCGALFLSAVLIFRAHDCSGQTLGLGMAIGLAAGRIVSILTEAKP